MRGAGDDMRIGDRVAFYRVRRGITQRVLADLVGRSEDWVSKVERGVRDIRRVDVVINLARALRIEPNDLLGQPVLVEDDDRDDDVPAVRNALMAPRRLSRTLFERRSGEREPIDLDRAGKLVKHAWTNYQNGRSGAVLRELPGLIQNAQDLEDAATSSDRRGWAVSARTHHLVATTLAKLGETDLAWMAAERAVQAADRADDPLVLASASRAATHALLASGRLDDAVELGNAAAEWMRARLDDRDPQALSLLGMLRLRTAVAAARKGDRTATAELVGRADRAAQLLGRDANYWQTGFGPTNVAIHRLATSLYLGDVDHVVRCAPAVDVSGLPVERRVSHAIDLARALSLVADDEPAARLLLDAEQVAPHLVRHNPTVRETVKALLRRGAATCTPSSPLGGLAERCRAVP